MSKILVFSHSDFDKICSKNKWNDNNVEALDKYAFVSIIGTKESQEKYLKEEETHYFKENHINVINLEFDDVGSDDFIYDNIHFKGISDEQATELFKFIDLNKGKTFFIHCRAGKSRSQGVCRYILDMYKDYYTEKDINTKNPCLTPNYHTVSKLKRMFYKNFLGID